MDAFFKEVRIWSFQSCLAAVKSWLHGMQDANGSLWSQNGLSEDMDYIA